MAMLTDPRLRVNKTDVLTLSTSWQKVDFSAATGLQNNFGKDPATGNPNIYWDSTAKILKTSGVKSEMNVFLQFNGITLCNGISLRTKLFYRFGIPNGVSAGVDYYFPNPDNQAKAMGSLGEITVLSSTEDYIDKNINVYIEDKIMANGFYMEVKLASPLATLATCTIQSCNLLLQSIGK